MNEPLLTARDLCISFGGVTAADSVDLDIKHDEIVAIIGPNGSGKTTFLNLCTGYIRPSRGSVHFGGRSITGLSPRAITRLGIARAFQIPQLFTTQSLIENLMMAIAARNGIWDASRPLERESYHNQALQTLSLFSLDEAADWPVSALPEGMRKLADIAIAMALKPRLLLMDEPTSGVSASEKFSLMDTILQVLRREAVTALFVEHDMDVVERYAGRVLVWDTGRVIAAGEPALILRNPDVLERVIGFS